MWKKFTRLKTTPTFARKVSTSIDELLSISSGVTHSISNHKPLVALESTVITHGMPWPTNFHTVMELEKIIMEEGATPVTTGVMNGKIKAGFSVSELKELAMSVNTVDKPIKVSRHNIYNCRNIKYGGTTVSGAMIVAQKLGIKIFATGGIGGVHREVESTMDISTDLRELGRTPICVVSSGIKSFLDIPKTLEFLETEGVFVCTINSKGFPGFFTRSSGCKSPNNLESIEQVVMIIKDMIKFQLKSGMLVAVPIPNSLEKEGTIIQQAITKSLENAKAAKMAGSFITPFVLNQINLLTQGKSLKLNVDLIKNNVRVAAKLAVALQGERRTYSKPSHQPVASNSNSKSKFLVVGGSVLDINRTIKDTSVVSLETLVRNATYDCTTLQTCGGVGRNLAEVFHRLNEKCYFLSALGTDHKSDFIFENSKFLDFSRVKMISGIETANISIISCQNKEILFHIGNLSIFQSITPNYVESHLTELKDNVEMICLDGNVPQETMEYVIVFAKLNGIKIFVESTDVLLANKPLRIVDKLKHFQSPVDIISPNILEFFQIINCIGENKLHHDFQLDPPKNDPVRTFHHIKSIMRNTNLLDFIPNWIIKFGSAGVIFASKKDMFFLRQSMFFVPKRNILKTSGAGDCLASCALLLHYKTKLSWRDSIAGSMRLVKESLVDHNTVPTTINADNYSESEIREWIDKMLKAKLLFYQE